MKTTSKVSFGKLPKTYNKLIKSYFPHIRDAIFVNNDCFPKRRGLRVVGGAISRQEFGLFS